MSASIGVYVATALFLVFGGDTEEAMKHDVWRQAGLCDKQCHWGDASPECRRQEARNLPCEVNHTRAIFWDHYLNEPERPWDPRSPSALWEQHLLAPEWVPSAEPTAHRYGGQWMKLRLEVAESEALPPPRPTFRLRASIRAASAPAQSFPLHPGRILGVIEAHVRTLAAVPANIIQRVQEGYLNP